MPWPGDEAVDALIDDLARVPLMPESEIDRYLDETAARVDDPDHPAAMLPRRKTLDLSPPELAVVTLLSQGRTLDEAAADLGKSGHTVRAQMVNARRKLQTVNITETCCEAIRRGLIE